MKANLKEQLNINLEEVVSKLPKESATKLGEFGSILSEGQNKE